MMPAQVHFGLVSSAAAIASLASLALSVAGRARPRRPHRPDGHRVLDDDRAVRRSTRSRRPGFIVGPNGDHRARRRPRRCRSAPACWRSPRCRRCAARAASQPLIVAQVALFVGVLMLRPDRRSRCPTPSRPSRRPSPLPRSSCSPSAPPASALLIVPRRAHLHADAPQRRPRRSRSAAPGSASRSTPTSSLGPMTLGFYVGHLLEIGAVAARRRSRPRWTSSAPAPRARWSATSPRPSSSPPRRPTSGRACAP